MRERTLRTLPFNGVNWVVSLREAVQLLPINRVAYFIQQGGGGQRPMFNLKIGFFKNQTSPRLRFAAVALKKPIICSHSAGGGGGQERLYEIYNPINGQKLYGSPKGRRPFFANFLSVHSVCFWVV